MITKILSDLVSFKTITPFGDDAIAYCADFLENLGFRVFKMKFGEVSNLYARLGNFSRNLCFAGHIDVVDPLSGWNSDPFILREKDGIFYGRGVNDMKGPLSSCLWAVSEFLSKSNPDFSISFILTSDEEIMGDNGTCKVVELLKERNEQIEGCVLCESCSPRKSGEYIKIGCRGSLNIDFRSQGKQCHVVSGSKFGNHLHEFVKFLSSFVETELDQGNDIFSPSDIEMTSIDFGNKVRNIIPQEGIAKFNIRFNNLWDFERLEKFILEIVPSNVSTSFERFGKPFIGAKRNFIDSLKESMERAIGISPEIGTEGGNSDALSISQITDVVEIGSSISEAHIVNEFISKEDLERLKAIYLQIIKDF